MVDPQIVLEWLDKARADLEFARINLEEKRPYYAQICFHFQQSAEKFLNHFTPNFRLRKLNPCWM